jgi:hypothetical protein
MQLNNSLALMNLIETDGVTEKLSSDIQAEEDVEDTL